MVQEKQKWSPEEQAILEEAYQNGMNSFRNNGEKIQAISKKLGVEEAKVKVRCKIDI